MVTSILCQILIRDPVKRQWVIGRFLQKQCGKILAFLNIEVISQGFQSGALSTTQNYLILPNHISYLDVVVLNSLFPAMFVTSRDIETTPFLGSLCRYAGCLFVNRFAKKDILRDINDISRHLNTKGATPVVLFPEGTTSNGLKVLAYKKSLIQAALQSRCQVIPMCLKYAEVDGKPFDASCHDRLAWYGPMRFFPHLWQLMSIESAKVEVFCGSPMVFREQKCRKKLADAVRSETERLFYP